MKTTKSLIDTQSRKAGIFVQTGALLSAILASACCWLPILLTAFGVSGGALSAKFEELRPVLLSSTFVLLGLAFYFTYRRQRAIGTEPAESGEGCCVIPTQANAVTPCCPSKVGRKSNLKELNKLMIWVFTFFVLAFAFFPNYLGFLLGTGHASIEMNSKSVEWTIAIDGMTCQGCVANIAAELQRIRGVGRTDVDYRKGTAVVDAVPSVSENELRKAIETAGYSVVSIHKTTRNKGGSR